MRERKIPEMKWLYKCYKFRNARELAESNELTNEKKKFVEKRQMDHSNIQKNNKYK